MGLTLSHATALYVLRQARIAAGEQGLSLPATDFMPPDAGDGRRWTTALVSQLKQDIGLPSHDKLDVLASSAKGRVRHGEVRSHVCGAQIKGLCFLELRHEEVVIPSPELLLAQMAESLPLPDLVALGHELCGKYSIRPWHPAAGAVFDLPTVTSPEKISSLLKGTARLRGSRALATALPFIQENSLSPPETALSVMTQLPLEQFGYAIGPTILNKEIEPDAATRAIVTAGKRVPDILFADTPVGLNYDGDVHLDFRAIIRIAKELALHPNDEDLKEELRQAIDDARRGTSEDKQRDRDLLAMDLVVLPITKYDTRDIKDLDRVMGQVMHLIEATTGRDMSLQRQALSDEALRDGRAEVFRRLFRI